MPHVVVNMISGSLLRQKKEFNCSKESGDKKFGLLKVVLETEFPSQKKTIDAD